MISKKTITRLAIFAGLGLVTSTSFAVDDKRYPGADCRQISGGIYNFFGGTVFNSSTTSALGLMCPFVKDSAGVTSGSVTVYDRHPSQDISCTIFSELNNASGNFFTSAAVTSSGFGSAPQVLGFGALPNNEYYYATCTLPPSSAGNVSHLASFVVNEP